jgi:undecaprenyl-diphosphatase
VDPKFYLWSIVFGIIEGLTEFLPVSSTAHLRLVKPFAGISLDDPYWKMYDVVIQLGAILAVVVYFRTRILDFLRSFPRGSDGSKNVLTHPVTLVMLAFTVTSVPIVATELDDIIKDNLGSLWVIGVALLVGGIVMWVVDATLGKRGGTEDVAAVKPTQAVIVGAAQILAAVFPGTSRSMATIAGGQVAGMSRTAALEFSFFLAIPTMTAAFGYDLLKTLTADAGDPAALDRALGIHDWGVLAVGFVVSFFVAWAVIAWFMGWVKKRGFVPFAIYRIVLGIVVIAYASTLA